MLGPTMLRVVDQQCYVRSHGPLQDKITVGWHAGEIIGADQVISIIRKLWTCYSFRYCNFFQ